VGGWEVKLRAPKLNTKKAPFFQMRKNRKSHVFGHCLSTKTTPEVVDFDAAGLIGGIINAGKKPGLVFAKLYPTSYDHYLGGGALSQ
jgi:hypothetical protein